jgi:hypothetical protein
MKLMTPESTLPQWLIEVRDPQKDYALVVRLGYDGLCETGENYNPDRAAELFWEAIGNEDIVRGWCARRGFQLVKEATS